MVIDMFPFAKYKRQCFSELIGTYLLVLVGPGSVVIASLIPGVSTLETFVIIASAFRTTVAALVLLLGRISGANITLQLRWL